MSGPDARTGPDASARPAGRTGTDDGANQVWGLICTLVAGPAVWGAVGYGLDSAADTAYWTPIGVVVGFLTSFYIVYAKTVHGSTASTPSTRTASTSHALPRATPATPQHGRSELPTRDAARPDPGDVR